MAEKNPERALIERLTVLVEAQIDLLDKQTALLTEARTLLSGGDGIGTTLKRLEHAFDLVWCSRYAPGQSGRYVWTYAKDRPHLKRLINTLGYDEVCARMARYLASEEPFYTRSRHPFALFVAAVNSFVQPIRLVSVVGCLHTPRCRDDEEHTRKWQAELRGGQGTTAPF